MFLIDDCFHCYVSHVNMTLGDEILGLGVIDKISSLSQHRANDYFFEIRDKPLKKMNWL
jgi:hypothetical protein